ncbi:MAG: hypothetical protein IIA82_08100 [Thaumarchaeota archaeon]|nr:hypothetical protein [Nitrososphaerota archaeon]
MGEPTWFSYTQMEYDPNKLNTSQFWTKEPKRWNWDKCRFTLIPIGDNKVRIVIRRRKYFKSRFRRKRVQVDLMISVIVTEFMEPEIKSERLEGNNIPKNQNHSRKVIDLIVENDLKGDDRPLEQCQIWQLTDGDDGSIDNLYKEIKDVRSKPPKPDHDIIFDTDVPSNNGIIPVIYQPRIDVLKNFLREVRLKQGKQDCKATLVFNDEHLIKHWIVDWPYRLFRLLRYGRIWDVESFKIKHDGKTATHFNFENIYSGNNVLYRDSIHEDQPPAPDRAVKHWHVAKNHPIVFVNTANHAMAEFDTNHAHWKWEYVPWDDEGPVELK